MDDYKIIGCIDELSNMVLNEFLSSQVADETEREKIKQMLKVFNKYGVPSHKAVELIRELDEINREDGVNNE